jgi:hypothetical protein
MDAYLEQQTRWAFAEHKILEPLECGLENTWENASISLTPAIGGTRNFVGSPVGGEIDAQVSREHQIPTKSRPFSDFIETQLLI